MCRARDGVRSCYTPDMAASGTTAPAPRRGLSSADLEQIRAALLAGRKPKVVFTNAAGQIAGQVGHVAELADPAGSDEWIVVRFGRDELPFSPSDLALPARGAAARTVPAKASTTRRATAVAATEPEFVLDRPPTPREGKTMPTTTPLAPANGTAGPSTGAPANGTGAAAPTNGNGAPAAGNGRAGASDGAQPGSAPKPAKVAKPGKAPAGLVVTLAYADREWTVAATQGSKSLAKPYVIRPTEALRMVALIDVPGVHEAVESIIAAERAEAENRAQRLRSELADIESRLAELTHHG